MRLVSLSSCDSCKKAIKALNDAQISYNLIDIRKDGLTEALIDSVLAQKGEAALNKASTTWRGLSEEERAEPIAQLIARHPTLLKRPAIEKDGTWYLGWKSDVQALVLK